MYNFIAIMGEAGSGKDRTMQAVLKANPNFHEIVSCTSRPPREGEVHGINYFYYTPEQFTEKILNGEMLECTVFNNWYYGTSYDSVRSGNVTNIGVFNPTGVASLLDRPDCKVLVFRVVTDDKERLIRQLTREQNPNVREIIRRFQADLDDFDNIEFDYVTLYNNVEEDIARNVQEILSQSESYFTQGQN